MLIVIHQTTDNVDFVVFHFIQDVLTFAREINDLLFVKTLVVAFGLRRKRMKASDVICLIVNENEFLIVEIAT